MPVHGKTKSEVLSEFRRRELMTAAIAVFGKKGFHETRVEDVAGMAGVAKGTVYLYYKSKRELYMEALRFGVESLNDELRQQAGRPGGCLENLRLLTETKMAYFEENRDFFRIYFSELGRLPAHPAGVAMVRDLYREQAKIFGRLLRDGIQRKEIREIDIDRTAFAIADLTRGVTTQRMLGPAKKDLRDDVEFVVDLIWRGIVR